MLSPPNAILFDLDGTLLDTARDLGNALNQILTEHQQPNVDYSAYRNIASDGAKGMLELGFGDNLVNLDLATLRQTFLDYYEQNICVDTVYFDGIEMLLTALNSKHVPWGIVTNKPENLTLELVKNFPLLQNCDVIIAGDTLEKRKPHPLPLLHAQNAFKLVNPNTWYVGDAERDIQAARAAKMVSVIAKYGYIDEATDISHWQADHIIQHPKDLLTFL